MQSPLHLVGFFLPVVLFSFGLIVVAKCERKEKVKLSSKNKQRLSIVASRLFVWRCLALIAIIVLIGGFQLMDPSHQYIILQAVTLPLFVLVAFGAFTLIRLKAQKEVEFPESYNKVTKNCALARLGLFLGLPLLVALLSPQFLTILLSLLHLQGY